MEDSAGGGGVGCEGFVNRDVRLFVHDKVGIDGGTGVVSSSRAWTWSCPSSCSLITSDCANSTTEPCTGRRGEYTITLDDSSNGSETASSRGSSALGRESISSSALQTLVRRPSSEPFINTGLLRA